MAVTVNSREELVFCPQCGTKLPLVAMFCPGCGVSLMTFVAGAQVPTAGRVPDDVRAAVPASVPVPVPVSSSVPYAGYPSEPPSAGAIASAELSAEPSPEQRSEPALPVNSATVLGLSEDDARAVVRLMSSAYAHIRELTEAVGNMEAVKAVRDIKRQHATATGIVAVVLAVIGVIGALITPDATVRVALTLAAAAASVVVAAVSLCHVVVFRRLRADSVRNQARGEHCDRMKRDIEATLEPLTQRLPAGCRTERFFINVARHLESGSYDTVGEAMLVCDGTHMLEPRDQAVDDTMGDRIAEMEAAVTAIYAKATATPSEDDGTPVDTPKPTGTPSLIPVACDIIAIAVSVALCVTTVATGVFGAKTYFAGFDTYPSWMPETTLSKVYGTCSQYADHGVEDGGDKSNLQYHKNQETVYVIVSSPDGDDAESSDKLMECVYEAVAGESQPADQIIAVLATLAADASSDDDGDAVSDIYYLQDVDVELRVRRGAIDDMNGIGTHDDMLLITLTQAVADDRSSADDGVSGVASLRVLFANRRADAEPSPSDDAETPSSDDADSSAGQQPEPQAQPAAPSEPDFDEYMSLYETVELGNDMTPIAGEYCRNDGSCVTIDAGGTITMTSSVGEDPLPTDDAGNRISYILASSNMGGAGEPQEAGTIGLCADDVSDIRCQAESGRMQLTLFYAQPGLDMSVAGYGQYASILDTSNPPDASKAYLYFMYRRASRSVIDWQSMGALSDSTVFYRQ